MKICVLTPTFLPKMGGTEMAVSQLAQQWHNFGHWVGVLTQKPRHLETRDEDFVYPVRRYRRPPTLRGWFWGIQRALSRWHKEIGFDIITAHQAYPAGYAACLWGRKHGVPVVISCRGGDVSEDSRFRRRPAIVKRLGWGLRTADAVTAVSENLLPAIGELSPGCQAMVIYNGVDASLAEPIHPPVYEYESWYPTLSGHPFLLAIGRLHPVKGFDLLIQAYAEIKDRLDPAVKLVIAGSGRENKPLQKLIRQLGVQNDVLLVGQTVGAAKAWLLQHCRALVLSSHRESFGIVLLEAMICGRPVLATPCVAPISVITAGGTVLAESADVPALKKGLFELLQNRDLAALGETSRRQAISCLWPVVARRYLAIFQKVVYKSSHV